MSRQLGRTIALLLILLLVLLTTGCGAQPTPQIVRETVPVPMTVIVEQTVEVTREVTRVVTVTPTPRPTATPTPAATPTPVVVAPAGWVTYSHPAGVFTVMIPPDASIMSEDEHSVSLTQPGRDGLIVSVAESIGQVVGDESSINEMVAGLLDSASSLDTARAIDKGFWTTPVAANYFEWSVLDYVYKFVTYRFMLVIPVGDEATIMTSAVRLDQPISAQQKTELGIMASTIRLQGE